MGNTFYFEWEPLLMAWIQGGLGDFGVKIMSFFSMLGEETIMVAVFAFVYYIWDKKAGVFIGINLMSEGFGADGHPSMKTHVRIGAQLGEILKEILA